MNDRRADDARVDAIAREVSTTGARLTNIESSLASMQTAMQDMARAMVSVARVEERLAASHDHQERMAGQIQELQHQLRELSDAHADRASSAAGVAERSRWLERGFWLLITGLIAYWSGVTSL